MKSIFLFAIAFCCFSAGAQTFKNLDFTQLCDSSKTGLCYWDLSWGAKGSVKQADDHNSKNLLITGSNKNDVGFTEQSAIVNSGKGIQIITVEAAVRSENIEGKGAGLNVQVFNKEGKLIAYKDMGGFYSVSWIQGTSNWKIFSISLVCPDETYKVKIGAILYGKGKAWFKNYKVMLLPIAYRKPNALALKYISAVCDTIKKNSLVRDSINIRSLKATALKIAGNAKQYSDCYLAVNYLLESLRPYGDEHSFFMTAGEVKNLQGGGSLLSKIENPSYKIIGDYGYILVPPFHGTNLQLKVIYADSLQSAIKKLDASGIKGWVIDLRENTGGDMEPMIEGLGPLFSTEKLGSLVNVNNKYDGWHYKDGTYFWDDGYRAKVLHAVTISKRKPIAVLISNQTGSSGEAVVISFIGNEQTRFFGEPTWGLTTGNGSFDLMDGANIHLASTVMADKYGKKYYGPIPPDEVIANTTKATDDIVVQTAIRWLQKNFN